MKLSINNVINWCFVVMALNLILGKFSLLIGLPSFSPDLLSLFLVVIIWVKFCNLKFYKNSFLNFYRIFLLGSLLYVALKLIISESFFASISSIHKVILVQIFFIVGLKIEEENFQRIIKSLNIIGLLIGFIAISQFFFWENIPRFFLSPSLVDDHVDGIMFGLVKGVRSNGLFGNPLELSAFFILLLYINRKYSLIKFSSIIFTLSRAGILSLFIIYVKKIKYLILILVPIFFFILKDLNINLGLFSRLFFLSDESASSSMNRFSYLKELINLPIETLLIGDNLGTTSARSAIKSSIEIYDGFFLNIIVEYGLLYFIPWIIIISIIFIKIYKRNLKFLMIISLLSLAGSTFLHPLVSSLTYIYLGYQFKNK